MPGSSLLAIGLVRSADPVTCTYPPLVLAYGLGWATALFVGAVGWTVWRGWW